MALALVQYSLKVEKLDNLLTQKSHDNPIAISHDFL